MPQRLNRPQINHPRANIAHDGAYLLSLRIGVTVRRATQTTLLGVTISAMIESIGRVSKNLFTFRTKRYTAMALATVIPRHETERVLF